MTAIDTNIVVRFITRDDPDQFARARALLASTVCYVPDTVVLETGWVLESIYEFSRDEVVRGLRAFLGLENVRVQDAERLQQALGWYVEGMDFADALHLAHGDHLERLKTFDQRFIKRAAGRSPCTVEEP